MFKLGDHNTLTVLRFTSVGAYLGPDGSQPEPSVLLPNKYIPEGLKEGDELEVFVYLDHEDRPVATTLMPLAKVDTFAILKVNYMNRFGAFLDWGFEKDLFVPYSEQLERMEIGEKYLVHVHMDDQSQRLVASSKVSQYTEKQNIDLKPFQEVEVVIYDATELGFRVLIDNRYDGLAYRNEVFREVEFGKRCKAFIKQVRPDGKIDVSLGPIGVDGIEPYAQQVWEILNRKGGVLMLSDASAPEVIEDTVHMSKKSFKKAIGSLYKKRLISIEKDHIKALIQDYIPEGPKHLRGSTKTKTDK